MRVSTGSIGLSSCFGLRRTTEYRAPYRNIISMTLSTFWIESRRFTCFNFQRKHNLLVDPKRTVSTVLNFSIFTNTNNTNARHAARRGASFVSARVPSPTAPATLDRAIGHFATHARMVVARPGCHTRGEMCGILGAGMPRIHPLGWHPRRGRNYHSLRSKMKCTPRHTSVAGVAPPRERRRSRTQRRRFRQKDLPDDALSNAATPSFALSVQFLMLPKKNWGGLNLGGSD